jgi:hypothetical protein
MVDEEAPRFCTACGVPVADGGQFCSACGKVLVPAPVAGRGRSVRTWWLTGVVLLLLIAVGYGVVAQRRTQPQNTAVTPGPAADQQADVIVDLVYSTDLDGFGIDYHMPSGVDLTPAVPAADWNVPPARYGPQMFGLLSLGDSSEVGIMVDDIAADSTDSSYFVARVTFSPGGGANFTGQPTYRIAGNRSDPIEFEVRYPDGSRQQYALSFYGVQQEDGSHELAYGRECLRHGLALIAGVEVPVVVIDDSNTGLYRADSSTRVGVDTDADGVVADSELQRADQPFTLDGVRYTVREIAPGGQRITFAASG